MSRRALRGSLPSRRSLSFSDGLRDDVGNHGKSVSLQNIYSAISNSTYEVCQGECLGIEQTIGNWLINYVRNLYQTLDRMPVVNPKILTWARETAGYDLVEAARRLQIRDTKAATAAEKLAALESGKKLSRSMLVRMAQQYRRPLLAFYLNEPPRKSDRGEDFRTLNAEVEPTEAAIVDAMVRNIRARQSIVRAALISEGGNAKLSFINSYTVDRGVEGLVELIKQTAEINVNSYRSQTSQYAAFKYLRSRVEAIGVFTVLAGNLGSHHTNVGTNVFRGFALSDDIAPFVVVNDQDAKTAWSFTLLHEVAHLWLGATGISGGGSEQVIEQFCNDVASEILVPERDFSRYFESGVEPNRDALIQVVDEFATSNKVSPRLVAYRLLKIGFISEKIFQELGDFFYQRWRDARTRQREKVRNAEGGPSYYVVKRFRLGGALLDVTRRLLSNGELSTTQVGTVLGVRALNVGNMFADQRMM